jgi:hypothetical protein
MLVRIPRGPRCALVLLVLDVYCLHARVVLKTELAVNILHVGGAIVGVAENMNIITSNHAHTAQTTLL